MVFVLGFPAVIALAIGFELGGGYAQEQTVARPYGFPIPRDAPAGTYMILNPGQGRGPMYAILDGVRSPSMPAGTTEGRGLFTGGNSAMIWDSPREGSPMQPASPPAIQVVQAPSEQPVPMAQPAVAAQPLRMMRPAAVEAVQAPSVQIVQRNVPVAEVHPVVAPVQIVQRNVPVAEVAPVVAPVVAEPVPVVPAQAPVQQSAQIIAPAERAPAPVAIQAPVQQSAQNIAPAERAPVPVAIQAPFQQARATTDEPEEPEEPESAPVRAIQPSVQQPREVPEPAPARAIQPPVQQPREEHEPAPVRAIQPSVQQPREPVPEPNRAPVRTQQPARQPARATPIPLRASIQQPASDATVRIAQALPTGQARTLLTSVVSDITGTATTDTASPTGGATTTPTGTTTTTNGKTTTTNGKTTTTNGKTTLPTAIPGSAVSLTGQTDRLLITMVLGFVGYELFL